MFKRTQVAVATALVAGWAFQLPVLAQDQRIEITGSAIKRIASETSLPVQIIRREEIARTGATSVTDLIQRLPAMQNATTESTSVGGGGGGFSGASIHGVGETRTLVLLNGRRLAQFGGQALTGFGAAIDLNTLPLSAIDRVEVLTDGASALYGSDAVAGVVNFITRRNVEDGLVAAGYSDPKGNGAEETRFTLSKGFGNLDRDGFNVFLAYNADKRKPLNGVDREVAKSGQINFDHNGKRYQAFLGSPSAIPGNVLDDDGDIVNPYYLANNTCAPGNVRSVPDSAKPNKVACYFDFVAALEIYPERERQNFMASADVKLGANHTLFADILFGKTESTGIIAPVPGGVSIPTSSPLYGQYLTPVSGVNGSVFTADTTAFYRLSDMGRRADLNKSDFKNFVLGVRGSYANWDYEAGATYSKNEFENDISGYPGALALSRLRASGLLNPFVGPGQMPQASIDAIKAINYSGYWDGGTSELTSLDFRTSGTLAKLAGGSLAMAAGANVYQEKFQSKPSQFAQAKLADPVAGTPCDPASADPLLACDQRFGDAAAAIPYGADRRVWGTFVELNAPLTPTLELTGSLRYDHYDDVGGTTNGKISARWNPTATMLVRGSAGTGFKAPTVPQLKAAAQSFGVTASPYDCTPELAATAAAVGGVCQPNGRQYDVVAGGNAQLKPEKSRQATLGIVLDPTPSISFSADYWWLAIEDAFGQISEAEAFNNPSRYPGSWTTVLDIATNINYLAYNQANLNLGKAYYSGIDFVLQGRTSTPIGLLTSKLAATYSMREEIQLTPGGAYFNPIGANEGSLQYVNFRWQGFLDGSLKTGNWTNTLRLNFKSGYKDAVATVEVLGANDANTGNYEDVQLKIKDFYTLDFQTIWQITKSLQLTGGVLNLTDEKPPLSLAEGGAGKGQQYGYDDRYYDVRGRTFYINAGFSF